MPEKSRQLCSCSSSWYLAKQAASARISDVGGRRQRGEVERFFADLVQPLEQVLRLRPAARLVVAHDELRVGQLAEVLDALVEEVLLIELVEQREAALEPGEFAEVLQRCAGRWSGRCRGTSRSG